MQTLTAKQDATTVLTTTKSWDYGYRLRDIRSVLGTAGAVVSSFGYVYDDVDRRTRATLQDGSAWGYDYDDRNEVIGGKRFWADYSPVAGQQFEYLYDSIGNRKRAKEGGDAFGQNLRTEGYGVNNLNQYTVRTNSSQVDIVGAAIATTVSVNGNTNVSRHGEYYHYPLTAGSTLPVLQNVTNVATQGGSVTTTGALLLPSLTQSLQYDADGNLTNDTVWSYTWDAENRLTRMETVSAPTNGVVRLRLDFGYDWRGRRAIKTVLTNWNGSVYQTTNLTRYVYALSPSPEGGWNLLAELDESNAPLRTYAWGLDLSGSLEEAGGIGGLLSATHYSLPTLTTHFTAYDGNGNVAALVKTDGTISARYEYGPFGEPIRLTGSMAKPNSFRWSTRFWDEETGLVYYGYRYYSPSLGRWISRDPIEEDGGVNLYAFVGNDPIAGVDLLGQSIVGRIVVLGLKGFRKVYKVGLDFDQLLTAQRAGEDVVVRSRKIAKELAEAACDGSKPIHEIDARTGARHFHPADRSGGHIFYTGAAMLTFSYYAQGQGAAAQGAAFVADMFNPLSLPKDIVDIIDVLFDLW